MKYNKSFGFLLFAVAINLNSTAGFALSVLTSKLIPQNRDIDAVKLLHDCFITEKYAVEQCKFLQLNIHDNEAQYFLNELRSIASAANDGLDKMEAIVHQLLDEQNNREVRDRLRKKIQNCAKGSQKRIHSLAVLKQKLLTIISDKDRANLMDAEWQMALQDFDSGEFSLAFLKFQSLENSYQLYFSNLIHLKYMMAACKDYLENYEAALAAYHQILHNAPQSDVFFLTLERYLNLSLVLGKQQEIATGEVVFKKIENDIPEKYTDRLNYLAALAGFATGNYNSIEMLTGKISQKSSYFLPAQYVLAKSWLAQNQLENARSSLMQIIGKTKKAQIGTNSGLLYKLAQFNLGFIAYRQSQFRTALMYFTKKYQLDDSFEYSSNKTQIEADITVCFLASKVMAAQCKIKLGRHSEALKDLRRVLKLDELRDLDEASLLPTKSQHDINSISASSVEDQQRYYGLLLQMAQRFPQKFSDDQIQQIKEKHAGVISQISTINQEKQVLGDLLLAQPDQAYWLGQAGKLVTALHRTTLNQQANKRNNTGNETAPNLITASHPGDESKKDNKLTKTTPKHLEYFDTSVGESR